MKPQKITLDGEELPPSVPVVVNSDLKGTDHEGEYWKLLEMTTMDNLNTLYVAFTRAVNELYIYIRQAGKPGCDFSTMLWNYLNLKPEERKFEMGYKYTVAEVKRSADVSEIKEMSTYLSQEVPDCIRYKVEETGEIIDAEDDRLESVFENDPRRMGTLQHQVMQRIDTAEDLPDAIKYLKRKGIIDEEEGVEIEEFIGKRLQTEKVRRWFDGSLRILNERSLIGDGGEIYRPDRIMVDDSGCAVVIDYKFGDVEDEVHYGKQVKRYVDTLKSTGRFFGVKGYLWYMKQNKVVFVCD